MQRRDWRLVASGSEQRRLGHSSLERGLVLIRGRGFNPGDQIQFRTESYQEVHNATVRADSGGGFDAPYTPFVTGHSMGESKISATARNCSPRISFSWGAGQ